MKTYLLPLQEFLQLCQPYDGYDQTCFYWDTDDEYIAETPRINSNGVVSISFRAVVSKSEVARIIRESYPNVSIEDEVTLLKFFENNVFGGFMRVLGEV